MVRILLAVHGIILLHQLTVSNCRENKIVNLAFNKTARQITTLDHPYSSGIARLAVDGGLNSTYKNGTCSHTDLTFLGNTWWEVDLAKRYVIGNIKILNRDILVERLHDVRIDVFDNERGPRCGGHCITHKGPAGPGWLNLSCESSVTGRFVRITKPKLAKTDALTMCEVEIYGVPEKEKQLSCLQNRTLPSRVSVHGQDFLARSLRNCCFTCGQLA